MKRKYAALMLGMTLAITSLGAYAEETNAVSEEFILEENADIAEENADTEEYLLEEGEAQEEVYGKVTAIDETSITIELGTLPEDIEGPEGEAPAQENTDAELAGDAEITNAEADADSEEAGTEVADTADGESVPEDAAEEEPMDTGKEIVLELNGVNQIFSITDDTVAVMEQPVLEVNEEISAEEAADADTEENVADAEESADDTEENLETNVEEDTDSDVSLSDSEDTEFTEDIEVIMIPVFEETESEEIDLLDIAVDDLVKITLDEDGNAAVITVIPMNEPA